MGGPRGAQGGPEGAKGCPRGAKGESSGGQVSQNAIGVIKIEGFMGGALGILEGA